ncbi:MAG: hypothetical protein ABI707_10930, partial [Ferruginibacter sp.]
ANGNWSLDNKWLFVKTISATAVPDIIQAEYYIDTDPGYGNANLIGIAPSINFSNRTQSINPSDLSEGAHIFGIRAKDANGNWSLDNKWLFVKSTSATIIPDIIQAEYYIDTDPGYGNARHISITSGTNLSNLAQSVDPSSLSDGVHIFGIRVKDANGAWSIDNKWLFVKQALPGSVPDLTQLECYIDTDPGYGKAIPIAINPVTGIPDFNLPVNVTGLATGAHIFGIRAKDANGAWSLDNKLPFNISSVIAAPAIVVNSVANKEMCAGTIFNMSYHATGMNNGNVFTVQLSDTRGSFTNPQAVGSFAGTTSTIILCRLPKHAPDGTGYRLRVVSSNPVLTGIVEADSITIHNRPFVGNDTTVYFVCQGETVNLSPVYNTTSYSYQWDSTNITGVGPGVYGLMVEGTNGCNDTAHVTVQQNIARWLGTVSNDWHTAGNWSTGRVPDTTTHVIIRGAGKTCIISAGDGFAASVQVLEQAIFQVFINRKISIKPKCISTPPAN